MTKPEPWFTTRLAFPRLLSVGIHAVLIGIALIPWTSDPIAHLKRNETAVALYIPHDIVLNPFKREGRSGGGGGGGKRESTKASRGVLP